MYSTFRTRNNGVQLAVILVAQYLSRSSLWRAISWTLPLGVAPMDWPPVIERSSRTRRNRSRSARTSGGRKPELRVKYKLAIFDFDGTLADTVPWLVGVIDQVA